MGGRTPDGAGRVVEVDVELPDGRHCPVLVGDGVRHELADADTRLVPAGWRW